MGKHHSKQRFYRNRDGPEGECIVVNAHFNPIAVSELEDFVSTPKPPSELSFQLNGTKDILTKNFLESKYPLQVVLPPEGCEAKVSCTNEEKAPTCQEQSTEETTEEKRHLSLEEFECDVSVKMDGGMEKQEFLFTLYDLDGHGKITKDDIAGLVRSIYEAVGSSVKLPHTGSKTIKVRLTVSPDKKENTRLSSSNGSPATDSSKRCFGVAPVKLMGSPRHPSKKNNLMTVYRQNLIHMIKTSVLEKTQAQGLAGCENDFICEDFDLKHHHKHRHANNRDNIIECRDRRNHYLDLAGIENYNCKLADAINVNQSRMLNCPYQLDGTHICSKSAKTHVNLRTHKPGHHRSRSHDLSADSLMFGYQLLDKEQSHHVGFVDIFPNKYKWNNHSRSRSYDVYDEMCSPKPLRPHLRKAVANGHSTSPHHHKHRNREREHQRAMQQVANWIEREPLGVSGEENSGSSDCDRGKNNGEGDENKGNTRFSKTSPLVVEHHEHHHIHEHVHHHYHHYNEV